MKKPPNKNIEIALKKQSGILSATADMLGCSRQALRGWIDKDPKLTEIYKNCVECLKDDVEAQFIKNIKSGKETSLIFFAKTKMRERGYIEKLNVEANINEFQQQVIINVIDEETKLLLNKIDVLKLQENNSDEEKKDDQS